MKIQSTPVTDDAATVQALVNKQVAVAWYDSFNFVHTQVRSGAKSSALAPRKEDGKFRVVFITSDSPIKNRFDLKDKTVRFVKLKVNNYKGIEAAGRNDGLLKQILLTNPTLLRYEHRSGKL